MTHLSGSRAAVAAAALLATCLTVPALAGPARTGAAPTAGMIALSAGRAGFERDYRVHVVNPDGTGLSVLGTGEQQEFSPDWSPDGSRVAFMAGSYGGSSYDIRSERADGSDVRVLTDVGAVDPKWSPDGSTIAYRVLSSDTSAYGQVWTMNADGSGKQRLPYPLDGVAAYDWAPDGTMYFVAFNLLGSENVSIYRSPVTGTPSGGTTQLVMDGERMTAYGDRLSAKTDLEVSPDGSRLLFTEEEPWVQICGTGDFAAPSELYTVSADGSTITAVTRTTGATDPQETQGAWSPDGTRVVYSMFQWGCRDGRSTGSAALQTARVDGTDVRTLVTPDQAGGGSVGGGAWQPCTATSGRCSASTTGPPSPGASPSPSGPSPEPSPGGPSPTPPDESAPDVVLSPVTISAGQRVTATYTGDPGTTLEVLARTQPATAFSRIGTLVLDEAGTATATYAPQRNTRLTARTAAGTASPDQPLVSVRSVASLTVTRLRPRTYAFTGRVYPARDGRLVSLYRDGVLFAQTRTGATGTYRFERASSAGVHDFGTRTGNDTYNLGSRSPVRRVTVS